MDAQAPELATKRRWLRFSPHALVVVAILVMALIAYGIWEVHHVATEVVPNCYAVQWVASMVIDHMETHDGAWPSGWNDLREPYENVAKKMSYPRETDYPWTFDELRSRVKVDWKADPQTLAATHAEPGKPPFRVIWLRDGSRHHWQSAEPNQLILEYLRERGPKGSRG